MLKGLLKKGKPQHKEINTTSLDSLSIPKHIAIIMDGNGRWAKEKGLPRVAGHRAGMESIKRVVRFANKIGIQVITLYAFSTENWKRPEDEVKFLMRLPQEFLVNEIDELIEQNVRINTIGFVEDLPNHTRQAVQEAQERTKKNTGLVLNFALNYGSRNEIIQATKAIAQDMKSGKIKENEINEELMNKYLLTSKYPDPDLLIRTSGEQRISNFLLWQLAYAELWFTPVYWPEFNEDSFLEAIKSYQNRSRRFGGLL